MEEILTKYVKEKGVAKIIIYYKEDIERYETEEKIHMLVDDIIKEVKHYLKNS